MGAQAQTTITREQAIDHLTNITGTFKRIMDIVRTARGVMVLYVVNKPFSVETEKLLIGCSAEDAEVYMAVVRDNAQFADESTLK